MEVRMKRTIPMVALLALAAAAAGAQQDSQTNPYQGVSHPPADDQIMTSTIPEAKPPAGQPYVAPETTAPPNAQPAETPTALLPEGLRDQPPTPLADGSQPAPIDPRLVEDPDGDIVHPHLLRRGELGEGTSIRVRLLERLSTAQVEKGQAFRTTVATDVLQGDQVLIPAGAEIDGRVVEVSTGHTGGYGTMRLLPEVVILPNGTRMRIHAMLTGTPGSHTKVVGEGTVKPDSRMKRDGIEYGGAVGAGVVTGAIVGGPVGAATGGLIGAGVITVHLLVSHPQATLEAGTALTFMLSDRLELDRAERMEN
jgi:hypothetical protein